MTEEKTANNQQQTSEQRNRKASDTTIARAIDDGKANLTVIMQLINGQGYHYTRRGIEKRIAGSAWLSERLADARAIVNDYAEWNIIRKMQTGDIRASQYWLEHHHPSYMPTNTTPEPPPPVRPIEEIERELREAGYGRIDGAAAPNEEPKQEKKNP